jgi:hypothetical protein
VSFLFFTTFQEKNHEHPDRAFAHYFFARSAGGLPEIQ